MKEDTLVRQNMMESKEYRPYCCNCRLMPRYSDNWRKGQLICGNCGHTTDFEKIF